jgi:predicted amidophosphoribosyltransferase
MTFNPFCSDCFLDIRQANAIFTACADSTCKSEHFEQIGYQFSVLASEARSSRMQVLANYAQAMAGFVRNLQTKSANQVDDEDKSLLQSGIQIGLPCQEGKQIDQCPNQNFDRVWPLIVELREHSQNE